MSVDRFVEEFEEAVRDDAWKGGGHPEDVPGIEARYKRAKLRLLTALRERRKPDGKPQ